MSIKSYENILEITFRTGLTTMLLAGALIMQGCSENKKNLEEKTKYVIPDPLLQTILIDTVKKCPLVNALKLTGMVDFDQDRQVNIFAAVSGNVQDIKVQLGDYVSAGQVLAIVKSSEMAGFSNNLVIAETTVKATKKQLDATNDLYKSGLSSILDVTNAQVNYDQALSQLEMAKKILKINGDNISGDYIIKSPINGFIVQKNVTNNTVVRTDNGTNLFTISDLKDVWVQANVYETNINQVHLGDKSEVRILADNKLVFNGKVDKIMNVMDPISKVIKVRIVLANPGYLLKPQMYASVTVFDPDNKQALCISDKSLVYENSQYYVLVYRGKGLAEITPVEVLNALGNRTYLKSGVKEGDRIIASQALQIYSELNN